MTAATKIVPSLFYVTTIRTQKRFLCGTDYFYEKTRESDESMNLIIFLEKFILISNKTIRIKKSHHKKELVLKKLKSLFTQYLA